MDSLLNTMWLCEATPYGPWDEGLHCTNQCSRILANTVVDVSWNGGAILERRNRRPKDQGPLPTRKRLRVPPLCSMKPTSLLCGRDSAH